MITPERKSTIRRLSRAIAKKNAEIEQLRDKLADELREANERDKSTLDELGRLVGVSRQRIHQLVKK